MLTKELIYFPATSDSDIFLADERRFRTDIFDGVVMSPRATEGRGFLHADTIFDTSINVSYKLLKAFFRRLDKFKNTGKVFLRVNARCRRDKVMDAGDIAVVVRRLSDLGECIRNSDSAEKIGILFDAEPYGETFPKPNQPMANPWANISPQQAFDLGLEFGRQFAGMDIILSLGFLYINTKDPKNHYLVYRDFLEGILAYGANDLHDYIQQSCGEKDRKGFKCYADHPAVGFKENVEKFDRYFHGRSLFPRLNWTPEELSSSVAGALAEADKYAVWYDQDLDPASDWGGDKITKVSQATSKQRIANKGIIQI